MLYPQTRIRVKDKLCNFTPESHSNPYDTPMKTEFEQFDRFIFCSFSILRNFQLESDVCRLPYT